MFEIKKGKLKTKKLLKLTRYIRWTRNLSTISRESLKFRKYVQWKTWKVVVTAPIPENNSWVPCQRKSEVTISEGSQIQLSFIQQKVHVCLRPCSLDNTLNRTSSAWESFNIRQKLGLLVLGVTHHISNLPTICVKLMRMGGWV